MRRSQAHAALSALVLATPVATWCLIGDVSEPNGDVRMFEPPTIGRGLERAIGLTAAAVVLATVAVAVHAWHEELIGRAHRRATTPLVLAGALLAAGGRVVTSATVGANIGGGMLLLLAPVVLPPLLVLGTYRGWQLSRHSGSRPQRA